MRGRPGALVLVAGLVLAVGALAASVAPAGSDPPPAAVPAIDAAEVVHYRWRLEGFLGSLAAIFLPGRGDGTLTTRRLEGGALETILHITSPERDDGEHWTYGSRLAADGTPVEAWSAYTFRGESKHRRTPGQAGVTDVAAAIHQLRRHPPEGIERLEIWSEGKVYPVEVRPLGDATIELGDRRRVRTRHLAIRGLEEPGRRRWKGSLELWLAYDAAATPAAIAVERSLARVRLLAAALPEVPAAG